MEHQPKNPPLVTGQRGEVLRLIREYKAILSFILTAEHAIPGTFSRVSELKRMGFNIITTILPEVVFRGRIRRNVARYNLGIPEWIPPIPLEEPDLTETNQEKEME